MVGIGILVLEMIVMWKGIVPAAKNGGWFCVGLMTAWVMRLRPVGFPHLLKTKWIKEDGEKR